MQVQLKGINNALRTYGFLEDEFETILKTASTFDNFQEFLEETNALYDKGEKGIYQHNLAVLKTAAYFAKQKSTGSFILNQNGKVRPDLLIGEKYAEVKTAFEGDTKLEQLIKNLQTACANLTFKREFLIEPDFVKFAKNKEKQIPEVPKIEALLKNSEIGKQRYLSWKPYAGQANCSISYGVDSWMKLRGIDKLKDAKRQIHNYCDKNEGIIVLTNIPFPNSKDICEAKKWALRNAKFEILLMLNPCVWYGEKNRQSWSDDFFTPQQFETILINRERNRLLKRIYSH